MNPTPWRLYVLVGALGLAAVGSGYAWWAVTDARSDLAACQSDKNTLALALERQTAAVAVWSASASAAQETARQALAAASAVAAQREPNAKRLEALLLAAASRDCGPAMVEIRKGLRP